MLECIKVPSITGLKEGYRKIKQVSIFTHVQANGLSMTAGNVVIIVIVSTLAAIGSASIPNSALVSMITVLQVHHINIALTILGQSSDHPHKMTQH